MNQQTQYVVVQQETNTMGVFGFCLMLLGYLTCGSLAIPAVFLCGFAMFKEPRGLAIAGFVLSLPAAFGFLIFGFLFAFGILATDLRPPMKELPTAKELRQMKAEKISEYREKP